MKLTDKLTQPVKSAATIAWLALGAAMLALAIALGGAFRASH